MGSLLFKLFLAFFGLLLLLGALFFLLGYSIWATLRWLITGQKPQVAVVWQQYHTMRRNFRQPPFAAEGARSHSPDADVVDVEARELTESLPHLPPADKH
jgi:hypothetical protein